MVYVAMGFFLFNDKNYRTNSYLLTDHNGNLVIVDPTLNTVNEMLEPLDNEDSETVLAILLTSQYLPEYDGISLLTQKYPNIDIYVGEQDLEGLRSELESNNIPTTNLKVLPDRIEIGELIFNNLATPGISPGSVCIRYKKFLMTGDTLLDKDMFDLTVAGVDPVALKHSLEYIQTKIQPDYFICPKTGNINRFNLVLRHNQVLNEFLKNH
ncbi:MBL fold metallo-hydrolase [Ureaplasma ceti]|uniref:Metallo-beta-lactamase domain-containing protein n=1 Tax=Ureaplasma ceti TaxID=3119530 RepID=A0ABP9UAS2_9BACT